MARTIKMRIHGTDKGSHLLVAYGNAETLDEAAIARDALLLYITMEKEAGLVRRTNKSENLLKD